jgi:hypothetical protein
MRQLVDKIKPASGFSEIIRILFNILLALAVFTFVRMHFVQLALAVLLLSKWRMFAVRPRFWPPNLRANAVDIIASVSILTLMIQSNSQLAQLTWLMAYIVWLVLIKPGVSTFVVSMQALLGMMLGLTALFAGWSGGPLYGLVTIAGAVCYFTAHHFFDSFEEPFARLLSYVWAYFGAAMVWVLGHWLLFYGPVAQPVLLLLALGYGMAAIYYLDHLEKLSDNLRRQFIFIMVIVVITVLAFSDWGDKIV